MGLSKSLCIAVITVTSLCAQASEPSSQTPADVSDQITSVVAGYCKAMQDKQGMAPTACVTQVTDMAIVKLKALAAQATRASPEVQESAVRQTSQSGKSASDGIFEMALTALLVVLAGAPFLVPLVLKSYRHNQAQRESEADMEGKPQGTQDSICQTRSTEETPPVLKTKSNAVVLGVGMLTLIALGMLGVFLRELRAESSYSFEVIVFIGLLTITWMGSIWSVYRYINARHVTPTGKADHG